MHDGGVVPPGWGVIMGGLVEAANARRSVPRAIGRRARGRLIVIGSVVALSLAGVAASVPAAPAAFAATLGTPAITVAGGNSVIAAQTQGNGLEFFWNQYGTNTWRAETVAGDGTTFSSPSIAQDGNSVVIAARGINNSLNFYWQSIGGTTWNPEQVAGPGTTFSAPSLTPNGNAANIVAQGPGNSLDYYWQTNGTAPWHPEVVAGGGTTFSAPSIASNNTGPIIAAEGASNSLDFYWQYNGNATWYPEVAAGGGTTYSQPAIINNAAGNGVNIAAEGPFDSLYFYWATNGTATWHLEDLGAAYGTPALVAWGDPRAQGVAIVTLVPFVGSSTVWALQEYSAVNGSTAWTTTGPLTYASTVGTPQAVAPVTAVENNGDLNIAGTDNSGGWLLFYWQENQEAIGQAPWGPITEENAGSLQG